MNREMKRMLQRQGELGKDGQPISPQRRPPRTPRASGVQRRGPRKSPLAYLREVRTELRKVNWPTRTELKNYSAVVLFTLVAMIAYVTALEQVFQRAALYLFK